MFGSFGSKPGRKATGWAGIFQGFLFVGNSTANVVANSSGITAANSTGTANLQPTQLVIGTSVVNSTVVAIGANVFLSTTTVSIGNSTANIISNSTNISVGANVDVTPTGVLIGNSTVNVMANSTSWYVGGNNVLLSNTSNNIGAGFTITAFNAGTKTSGSFTPDPTKANYQFFQSNGNFTLAAPSSDCAIDLLANNGTGAGTITFSGFTVGTTGDALDTTSSHKFLIMIRRINGVSMYAIKALQ